MDDEAVQTKTDGYNIAQKREGASKRRMYQHTVGSRVGPSPHSFGGLEGLEALGQAVFGGSRRVEPRTTVGIEGFAEGLSGWMGRGPAR